MTRVLIVFSIICVWVAGCDATTDTQSLTNLATLKSPATGVSGQAHLARGDTAGVIMSWVEERAGGGHRLMYSVLDGGRWGTPVAIAGGDNWFINWADFPSVIEVRPGFWAAHWLVNSGDSPYAYDIALSLSGDGGKTWSDAITPHKDRTQSEHGFVSMFTIDGELGLVWLDGRETAADDAIDASMTLRSARFDAGGRQQADNLIDPRVCDCCQTDAASNGSSAFAVYRDRSFAEIRDISITRNDGNGWAKVTPVDSDNWQIDACPVNGPAISVNGDVLAVAWFTGAGNTGQVRLARSTDSGRTFASATLHDAKTPLGRVDVEVLHDGRIVVSWLEQTDGQSAELRAQSFGIHGKPSGTAVIANVASAYLSGFPQMTRRGNDLIFAWTSGTEGATAVQSAILPIAAL